jgi:hypothetical protein
MWKYFIDPGISYCIGYLESLPVENQVSLRSSA